MRRLRAALLACWRRLSISGRLEAAIKRNEIAADELDAAVREVLRK